MGTYTPYRTFYRTQDESQSTVKWILRDLKALENKAVFISHIGDISYARGFSWIWDEFFNQIEPIAASTPYHVCIGNHEYDWPNQPWRPWWSYSSYNKDGGGECGIPYSLKFHMPGDSSVPTGTSAPATTNLYYSFDSGVVHFVYISTETNFEQGSDQYNFIKSDLERVNREKTPFIVLQGHRPMYTTSNEVRDASLREKMLQSLEPLLVQYKVTLALWGHVHRYERFCPVKNFQCVNVSSSLKYAGAPVHMVIGMAGQDWQPVWEPRPDHQDKPIFPQPVRSMYRGGEFGYTRLVATKEKLKMEYVGNHDGQVHDMVEIFSDLYLDNSNNNDSTSNSTSNVNFKEAREEVVELTTGTYVKAGSAIMAALLLGYALGFFTKWRRETKQPTWTPVKSEEI